MSGDPGSLPFFTVNLILNARSAVRTLSSAAVPDLRTRPMCSDRSAVVTRCASDLLLNGLVPSPAALGPELTARL
jgi:hypothetical protein